MKRFWLFTVLISLGFSQFSIVAQKKDAKEKGKNNNVNTKDNQKTVAPPMPEPPSVPVNGNKPTAEVFADGKLFQQTSTSSAIRNINGKYYFTVLMSNQDKELYIQFPYEPLMGKRTAFFDTKVRSNGDSLSSKFISDKIKNITWVIKNGTFYVSDYNEGTQTYSGLFQGTFFRRQIKDTVEVKTIFLKGKFVNVPFSLP